MGRGAQVKTPATLLKREEPISGGRQAILKPAPKWVDVQTARAFKVVAKMVSPR